mmetsp:Transcript_6705/g.21112  ORF Transcript_6705/g.21112 Transcript_6705/m.21112 type:complete len:249 (-) Transcript_6705:79-825(-)
MLLDLLRLDDGDVRELHALDLGHGRRRLGAAPRPEEGAAAEGEDHERAGHGHGHGVRDLAAVRRLLLLGHGLGRAGRRRERLLGIVVVRRRVGRDRLRRRVGLGAVGLEVGAVDELVDELELRVVLVDERLLDPRRRPGGERVDGEDDLTVSVQRQRRVPVVAGHGELRVDRVAAELEEHLVVRVVRVEQDVGETHLDAVALDGHPARGVRVAVEEVRVLIAYSSIVQEHVEVGQPVVALTRCRAGDQ